MDEENPKVIQSQTKTLNHLNFSKPKSRFTEKYYSQRSEQDQSQPLNFYQSESDSSSDSETEDDKFDFYRYNPYRKNRNREFKRKIYRRALIEWLLFLTIMSCLICSITVESVEKEVVWGLRIWKWCLMIMVLFCGRLVSGCVVRVLVFLIERNFMLREKVLYFVYGLRKSFQNCVWLGLVLVSWMMMFPHVNRENRENVVLKKVFRGLVAVLIAATIWLIKILLVQVLASSFYVAAFFDRMKESVFHHYILDTLSGPPLNKAEIKASEHRQSMLRTRERRLKNSPRRIDMERLKRLSMERLPSAWSVRRLIRYIMSSGLSTISKTVDDFGRAESEITSEWEARNCAQRVFKNVARPGAKYIEEEDLLRFLKSQEIYSTFPLFEGAVESGRISKSSLRDWVVQAYIDRKSLAHSLNDTKTAVHQLQRVASVLVMAIIVVVTLLVMGLATTKVIFLVTSQLLLVGFMFQNTCKTMFESIIFVFVMHPFDVGDRCIIDGVQMTVEEMNILSTVFLRYDMEKIYYPNSVLLTKPISNFRRSPDMADSVDFSIDVSTSVDDFNALKKAIQIYIEGKPKYWSSKHSLVVKEIENVDKMQVCLCVHHTMNHQNYSEKTSRRSDLVFELKKIFENLGIKYHLLPQQVHLTHVQR